MNTTPPIKRSTYIMLLIVNAIHAETREEEKSCTEEVERQIEEFERELADITQQRDTLAESLRGIMQVTTPNPYMPYCNDDRVWGIANDALAAVKGGNEP